MSRLHLIAPRLLSLGFVVAALAWSSWPVSSRDHAFAAGERATSLASLLLTPSDIKRSYGPGFTVLISRATSNSELRKTLGGGGAAVLQGLTGRVSGYESMYTHQLITLQGKKVSAKPGVSLVLSGVNQYQNTAYARRALNLTEHSKGQLPKGSSEHLSPLPGVGDSAFILSVHTIVTGIPPTDSDYIGFQRGRYTAVVDVAAYGGKPNAAAIVGLARVMDARIRGRG